MIESLKYVVTFNTTGRTLKNQLNFKPGITVIKGENEVGKSFVLEMIRFALFGSDALRGLKTDYDLLDVTLIVNIKGKQYKIRRHNNRAWVNENEAVGTTAVNQFIINLLGFGLSVFDIACNAKQGQLDRLTEDMKPSERKKMIDEVTGLHQFERVEKECREEANTYRKVAEAMASQLSEPEAPHKPDDYEPSETLQERLDVQIRNETLRESLVHMEKPEEPKTPEGDRDVILEHEKERESQLRQRRSLQEKLDALPTPSYKYDKPDLMAFRMSVVQANRGPLPQLIDPTQLEEWRHANIIRASDEGPVKCPKCGEIISGRELPPLPPMSIAEIDAELKAQRAWEGQQYLEHLPESPLSLSQIDSELAAYDAPGERKLLEKQLQELGEALEDRSEASAAWLVYDRAVARYEHEQHSYGNYLQNKIIIDRLPEAEPFLREKLDMALRYETLNTRYEAAVEIYDMQQGKIEAADAKKDGFKKGAEALKDIRREVKRYLIPSLSKVSSHLLQEMTDGERRTIKIDEEFEIYVDNQHVRTLSGSGVSVVNLALRIALGQVLTQSVIPFFLADEIDANMAAKRTKATHDSLKRLKSRLKQIIVVTHKEFEGDQSICLS